MITMCEAYIYLKIKYLRKNTYIKYEDLRFRYSNVPARDYLLAQFKVLTMGYKGI